MGFVGESERLKAGRGGWMDDDDDDDAAPG